MINNVLRPKTTAEIIKSAKKLEDPDNILYISLTKIQDISLAKYALKNGANINNVDVPLERLPKDIVKLILDNISEKVKSKKFIYAALKNGFGKEVTDLIERQLISLSMMSDIYYWAIGFKNYDLVKIMIDNDVIIEDNKLIDSLVLTISENDSDMLKLLVNSGEIDPSIEHNTLFNTAIIFNNKEAVKFLLNDEMVDPSSVSNKTYNNTSSDIKKMLINDERFENRYNYRRELNKINVKPR